MIDKNRYDCFGNKIIKEKRDSIKKQKDLDLHLYLDLQNELVKYRASEYKYTNMTMIELNKLRNTHNKILEKLAKRLNIPTISENLKILENFKK